MNKKLLVGLSSLLKIDETVITEAISNESGDDSIIKTFNEKNNVFTLEDVATLKRNSQAAALSELETAAELPQKIYNRAKGFAFEKFEKETAKKYGVDNYEGLNGLISKIAAKGKGVDGESEKTIEALRKSLTDSETSKTTALKEQAATFTNDFIDRDFVAVSGALKLTGENAETIKNQRALIEGAFKNSHQLSYIDGKTIVSDSEGKQIKDKLEQPMSLTDVFKSYAVSNGAKIQEVNKGGNGDGSTFDSKDKGLKGKTFNEVLEAAGVKPNTNEADDLFAKHIAANK